MSKTTIIGVNENIKDRIVDSIISNAPEQTIAVVIDIHNDDRLHSNLCIYENIKYYQYVNLNNVHRFGTAGKIESILRNIESFHLSQSKKAQGKIYFIFMSELSVMPDSLMGFIEQHKGSIDLTLFVTNEMLSHYTRGKYQYINLTRKNPKNGIFTHIKNIIHKSLKGNEKCYCQFDYIPYATSYSFIQYAFSDLDRLAFFRTKCPHLEISVGLNSMDLSTELKINYLDARDFYITTKNDIPIDA